MFYYWVEYNYINKYTISSYCMYLLTYYYDVHVQHRYCLYIMPRQQRLLATRFQLRILHFELTVLQFKVQQFHDCNISVWIDSET